MPRVSVSRVIAAPRNEIWATLSDIAGARRWNEAWEEIEITSTQTHGQGTTFRTRTDGGDTFEFEVSDWVAPEFISFSPIREPGEQMYSINLESHAFRLEDAGEDATTVELIAHASTRGVRGLIIGMFFWGGYQKKGLNLALDSLQGVFEPMDDDDDDEAADDYPDDLEREN